MFCPFMHSADEIIDAKICRVCRPIYDREIAAPKRALTSGTRAPNPILFLLRNLI